MPVRYRPEAIVLDRYLIDVDPMDFVDWDVLDTNDSSQNDETVSRGFTLAYLCDTRRGPSSHGMKYVG